MGYDGITNLGNLPRLLSSYELWDDPPSPVSSKVAGKSMEIPERLGELAASRARHLASS